MGLIHVMPEALANQIAAGEVVERPSSCVKELVENSLDAGAKHVMVTIAEGGIAGITVLDDGSGMDEADVVRAFERHATSKVRTARDLFSIMTLGFRGEALASIAAVARVRLSSRLRGSEQGSEYVVEGTDTREGPHPVGMQSGTRVEVWDLFYNTPARLKYLRSVATEQARCIDVIQRIAVGRPDVAFTCQVNDAVVFRSDGRGDVRSVLAALYGVGEARQFLGVQAESTDYRVEGFVGRPTQSRSNRNHGYLFINGRAIRNLALHQAIVAAFGPRLMVNRHPMYVIRIQLNPQLVDVNIHPHKAEVRFSEERDVTSLVERAVRAALDDAFLVSEAPATQAVRPHDEARVRTGPPTTSLATGALRQNQRPRSEPNPLFAFGTARPPARPVTREALDSVLGGPVDGQAGVAAEVAVTAERVQEVGDAYGLAGQGKPEHWHLRPIGQAIGMYVLADDGESLFIIDQHAAHEKILYERFHAAMTATKVGKIPLLTPAVVHVPAADYAVVFSRLADLAGVGLDVETFGGSDFVVRTVPSIWEGLDVITLATELLADATGTSSVNPQEALVERIVMRACKAAIKANWHLSSAEMQALCDALTQLDDPFHCPHGRPIFIRMSGRDLEKGFKRIV